MRVSHTTRVFFKALKGLVKPCPLRNGWSYQVDNLGGTVLGGRRGHSVGKKQSSETETVSVTPFPTGQRAGEQDPVNLREFFVLSWACCLHVADFFF